MLYFKDFSFLAYELILTAFSLLGLTFSFRHSRYEDSHRTLVDGFLQDVKNTNICPLGGISGPYSKIFKLVRGPCLKTRVLINVFLDNFTS